jgi:predicted transcriptional regulator
VAQPSTKQLLREVVEKLPPEATVEEAMERLYLLAKIERGIAQADAGQTLSSEEVRARLGL